MFLYEWKKLLLRRGGIWLLLLFFVGEIAISVLFCQPYDRVLEQNREVYDRYLSSVNGPLTQQKREFIESEMARLNDVHMQLSQLNSNYYQGKIPQDEYQAQLAELTQQDADYTGFAKLYTQYIYVREVPERRYFLYTGGWERLLTDWDPDYLLLLVLVLLLTPVFCEEYESRMDQILLTQKRSAGAQVLWKAAAVGSLTVLLTAAAQLCRVITYGVAYGLPNGNYPLESLVSFGASVKGLSILQGFFLQFALKELGYLYCALTILALSVLLKKFALTLMAGLIALPLPFLTLRDTFVLVPIPGPWALTVGTVYLSPSQELIGFTEMTPLQLGLFVLAVAVLMVLLFFYVWWNNTNWAIKRISFGKGGATK